MLAPSYSRVHDAFGSKYSILFLWLVYLGIYSPEAESSAPPEAEYSPFSRWVNNVTSPSIREPMLFEMINYQHQTKPYIILFYLHIKRKEFVDVKRLDTINYREPTDYEHLA